MDKSSVELPATIGLVGPPVQVLHERTGIKQDIPVASASPVISAPGEVKESADNVCDDEFRVDGFSTTLDVLVAVYLPLFLLWLRRSMFGTAHLIKSLLFGHFLHLIIQYISKPENTSPGIVRFIAPWIQSSSSAVSNSWPPPALMALAMLTVIACVVHPEGLTWILLGKLKECIMGVIYSSAFCWSRAVGDYGIVPTIIASFALAAVGWLVSVFAKTITPKKQRSAPVVGEGKKKRKKGKVQRGRGHQNSRSRQTHSKLISTVSSHYSTVEDNNISMTHAVRSDSGDSSLKQEKIQMNAKNERNSRVPLGSESVFVSDDHSCDESVKSFASAPTAVTISSELSGKSGSVQENTKTKQNHTRKPRRQVQKKKKPKVEVQNGDGSFGTPYKTTRTTKQRFHLDPLPINSRAAELKKSIANGNRRNASHGRGKNNSQKSMDLQHHLVAHSTDSKTRMQRETLQLLESSSVKTISPYAKPFIPAHARSSNTAMDPAIFKGVVSDLVEGEMNCKATLHPPPGLDATGSAGRNRTPTSSQTSGIETYATQALPFLPTLSDGSLVGFKWIPESSKETKEVIQSNTNGHRAASEVWLDEESSLALIEAELQELGGQMAGQVLDF